MSSKANLALVASKSGTDADAIMAAWRQGGIPGVENVVLISTNPDVGCLEKAAEHKVESFVIDQKRAVGMSFNIELFALLLEHKIDLVFLVGCVVKAVAPVFSFDENSEGESLTEKYRRIKLYNIHPARIPDHGGKNMYGLAVHEHVLQEAMDLIYRGMKKLDDPFFTYPTVHEATPEYDNGSPLLTGAVQIPNLIIYQLQNGIINLREAAKALQKVVLPHEWAMLPAAVNMAVLKTLKDRE